MFVGAANMAVQSLPSLKGESETAVLVRYTAA
jgi:hypothetical protein